MKTICGVISCAFIDEQYIILPLVSLFTWRTSWSNKTKCQHVSCTSLTNYQIDLLKITPVFVFVYVCFVFANKYFFSKFPGDKIQYKDMIRVNTFFYYH